MPVTGTPEFPCTVCQKEVKNSHNALPCDICSTETCTKWVHIKCQKLDKKGYNYHNDHPDAPFTCFSCLDNALPFSKLNHNQFLILNKLGLNFVEDDNLTYIPRVRDQNLFKQVNQAIFNNTHNITDNDADDTDDNTDNIAINKNCKYYGTDDFIDAKFKPEKSFSIFHLNIHSIERHISELRTILLTLNFPFDFICITETKIIKDINPKIDIKLPGYQTPVGTPTESTKGGVLIYAREGIECKPRPELNVYKSKELESHFIEVVNTNKANTIVGVLYRHPCMNTKIFNEDYLNPLISKLAKENKTKYIAGDFNFDLMKCAHHKDTFNFLESMMDNLLLPSITIPTRINPTNNSLIDNIFTDNINPDIKTGNLTIGISDHLPSFFIAPQKNTNHQPKKQKLYKRDLKNLNREEFLLDFAMIDWRILEINKHDPNHSLKILLKIIYKLLDKHAPLKKVTNREFKQRYKPWINDTILKKMQLKNRLFKRYVNCKDPTKKADIFKEFKNIKNDVTASTRASKKAYYQSYFTKHKQDLKKTWEGIREIINIKSKNYDHPTCITHDNKNITDPADIANKFNDYYTTVADNILDKRKYNGKQSFKIHLKNPLNNSITLYDCDETEVFDLILSIHPRKATGPNSIPTEILHMVAKGLAKPLVDIFNLTFRTGQFPALLRIAKTIPIFKKDSKLLVSNYRPISLLSNLNKILEKLMFDRVYKFLEKFKCFYKHQYGFRSKHSTNHALIDITETVRKGLDDGKIAGGVFVDLQKAFDTVNHEILIEKLRHYGIRGKALDWFTSYLTDRTQFVSILGFDSSTQSIKHGVPQGSVLGPLLFLIYINDLHQAISHSKVYHFADDTNLLKTCRSPKQLQKHLNIDLKLLYKWLLANKISLNCAKTELIIFHKPGVKIPFNFKIKMHGHKLQISDYIKYLGIYLDSTLSGNHHCEILSKKLNRANGMLSKIRHYVPPDELKSIYHAIFSSHMIYGSQIWGQSTTIHNEKVFKLQKKAMRIITFSDFHASADPIFKTMSILKLQDFIQLQNCLFVYDAIKNTAPDSFHSYFAKINEVHDINTINSDLGCMFTPFRATTRYGLNSIIRKCISSWNYFSHQLHLDLSSLSRFKLKSKITEFMLNQ